MMGAEEMSWAGLPPLHIGGKELATEWGENLKAGRGEVWMCGSPVDLAGRLQDWEKLGIPVDLRF